MADERPLPAALEALARELALLERQGFTLTGPERRFLAEAHVDVVRAARATVRRRGLRLIQGGRE